jgi:Cu2+-containing amine oxidase
MYHLMAFSFIVCFCHFELIDFFSTAAELSPPPEPFDPLADPEMKKAIEIINIAESIVDEVVNKLLNEVAEKVLKEG